MPVMAQARAHKSATGWFASHTPISFFFCFVLPFLAVLAERCRSSCSTYSAGVLSAAAERNKKDGAEPVFELATAEVLFAMLHSGWQKRKQYIRVISWKS